MTEDLKTGLGTKILKSSMQKTYFPNSREERSDMFPVKHVLVDFVIEKTPLVAHLVDQPAFAG